MGLGNCDLTEMSLQVPIFEHLVPSWVLFGEVLEPLGGEGFLEEGFYTLPTCGLLSLLLDVKTQPPDPAASPP